MTQEIHKQIAEALENYEQSTGIRRRDIGEFISFSAIPWLTAQQKQIEDQAAKIMVISQDNNMLEQTVSQQSAEIERLKNALSRAVEIADTYEMMLSEQ